MYRPFFKPNMRNQGGIVSLLLGILSKFHPVAHVQRFGDAGAVSKMETTTCLQNSAPRSIGDLRHAADENNSGSANG